VIEEQVDALMSAGGVVNLMMMTVEKLHDKATEFWVVFDE